jgi:hypothetical protein
MSVTTLAPGPSRSPTCSAATTFAPEDDLDTRIVSLEHGGDPKQRSRRTHAVNEGVDLAVRLTPDLLAQRVVARDAVTVVELVGPVSVRLLAERIGADDLDPITFGGADQCKIDIPICPNGITPLMLEDGMVKPDEGERL